MEKFLLFS